MVFVWLNIEIICPKNHVFHYLFLLPCMTFASFIPSRLKYNLSLCFFVATFIIFFSVFGAITVLCRTINTLLRRCVVPSDNVSNFRHLPRDVLFIEESFAFCVKDYTLVQK